MRCEHFCYIAFSELPKCNKCQFAHCKFVFRAISNNQSFSIVLVHLKIQAENNAYCLEGVEPEDVNGTCFISEIFLNSICSGGGGGGFNAPCYYDIRITHPPHF